MKVSIRDKIRDYLLSGGVLDTSSAYRLFQTHDLRRYISHYRVEGLNIKSKWVEGKTINGKVRFKNYWIEKEFKENLF